MNKAAALWAKAGGLLTVVTALLVFVGPCVAVSFGLGALFPAVSPAAKWLTVGIVFGIGAVAATLRFRQAPPTLATAGNAAVGARWRKIPLAALALSLAACLCPGLGYLSAEATPMLTASGGDPAKNTLQLMTTMTEP